MADFLKMVAVLYLVAVWGFFVIFLLAVNTGANSAAGAVGTAFQVYVLLGCVAASIPAAIVYAFGGIVEDVTAMREHLAAMRRYYEPNAPR